MKLTKQITIGFLILVAVAALYRIMPGRPFGFAPQIAIALFGGAVIKDKKWAMILPLLSLFVSDALYELLYIAGITPIYGFYSGQLQNYLLFGGLTCFGFMIRNFNLGKIALTSILAPTTYFVVSNSLVWLTGTGLGRTKTISGWALTLVDGIPFYLNSVVATVLFSALFFGSYYLFQKRETAVTV